MNKNIITTIKTRISKNAAAQGLKRYSLAEKAGISAPTVQNWYTKRNYEPTLDSLIKVSDALNMSLAQMCVAENETLYPVNEEQYQLINSFFKLDEESKDIIKQMIKKLKKD